MGCSSSKVSAQPDCVAAWKIHAGKAVPLKEARMCSELADLIYFTSSPESWCSRKKEPTPPSMRELPLHYRRKLGHYGAKLGDWNLTPPPSSYDRDSVNAAGDALWLHDGILFEEGHDVELLISVCTPMKAVIITYRGTEPGSFTDLLVDVQVWMVSSPCKGSTAASRVHRGFKSAYKAVQHVVNPVVLGLLDEFGLERVIVTGHSLGGAIATLSACDLAALVASRSTTTRVSAFTFGSPRVGNEAFQQEYDRAVPDTWRFVNDLDVVPRCFYHLGFRHVGTLVHVSETGVWCDPHSDDDVQALAQVHERPRTIRRKIMEAAKDHHAFHGYLHLMRYHRALHKLSEAQRKLLHEAWVALVPTKDHKDRTIVVQANEVSGLPQLVTMPLQVPDVAALSTVLQAELREADIEPGTLMRECCRLTRDLRPANFRHFVAACHCMLFDEPAKRTRRVALAKLGDTFDKYDHNCDGVISLQEFEVLWKDQTEVIRTSISEAVGKPMNGCGDDVQAIFKKLDTDADAGLTRTEFVSLAFLALNADGDGEIDG